MKIPCVALSVSLLPIGLANRDWSRRQGETNEAAAASRDDESSHFFIPDCFEKLRTGTFHFNEAGILTDFEYN